MRNKKTIIVMICVLVLSMLFVGCTARRPMDNNNQNTQNRLNDTGFNGDLRNANQDDLGFGNVNTERTTNRNTNLTNNAAANRDFVNPAAANERGYTGANNLATNDNYRGNTGYNYSNVTGRTDTDNVAGTPNNNFAYNNRMGLAPGNYGTPNGFLGTNNYGYNSQMGVNNQTSNNIARRPMTGFRDLEAVASTVTGVENATVVVLGNTCYVGIDTTNENAARNATNLPNIKSQVASKIKSTDNSITNVYVGSDADFTYRLRRVALGIRNGNPINTFTNELNQITRNLTPER